MTDIFLSYTERDRDTARRIAETLGSAGWSVWWDRRIPAGETWRSVLEHALENMRCMVVLWSAKSIESEWVYEEASEGRRQGKLVPVMIENVRPPAGFREIQAADLTEWDGSADFDGLRMLLSDLENLLGKPAAPAPRETSPAQRTEVGESSNVPYGASEVPGYTAPRKEEKKPRRPLWALAAALLAVGAAAFYGLSSRQHSTPVPAPPTPVSPPANPGAPPATAATQPAAPASPTSPLHPEVARDLRAAPETSTSLPVRGRGTPETSSPPRSSDSTRLSSARCANLLERIQLGETLSEASQARFDKECRQ